MTKQDEAPKGGSWANGGYEPRYVVRREDGKPIRENARYFVLQFNGEDPHALVAMRSYAFSVADTNPTLALDILRHLDNPSAAPSQH